MTFDSLTLAEDAFRKNEARITKDHGLGASKGAMAIIQKHISHATAVVVSKLETDVRLKDFRAAIRPLAPELVALVSLQGSLAAVAGSQPIQKTWKALGKMIELEVFAVSLKEWDETHSADIEAIARRRNSSSLYRKQAVRSMAQKAGFKPGRRWSTMELHKAGQWLVEVALELDDVFYLAQSSDPREQPYLMITEGAFSYSQAFVRALIDKHPVPLPLLDPPGPWTTLKLRVNAHGVTYEVPLVRREHCKVTQRYLQAAANDGKLWPVLDALSRIQSTAWRINERVLKTVAWCWEQKIAIEGLPPAKDIPRPAKLPEDEWGALTEEQRKLRRREGSEIAKKNRGFIGQRETLGRDLETASYIMEHGNRFWVPVSMDYRGRVYSTCHFNFQRQDYVRAMFSFADGKPLGPDGLYWLSVHLANCGDFGKISKKPFQERLEWVSENHAAIMATALDPEGSHLWWSQADAPFQFLAACIDFAAAIKSGNPSTYVSHLPVSFDGSCSGLQHFAAMTRCEVTAPLVNLVPSEAVSDVYQTVAEAVLVKVKEHAAGDGEHSAVAKVALANGIGRTLVKRNVMTWAYSSKQFGMVDQLRVDTMVPLADELLQGKREFHPYAMEGDFFVDKEGKAKGYKGRLAAKFLGALTFKTIEETVSRPAEAMRFLQGVSRALSHEGKPTVWHTPMGMPVVLYCPNQTSERLKLYLQDRGVQKAIQVSIMSEAVGIDKNAAANAVAPGFVHSMDACHLQMVVNEANQAGIHDVALVHDSFGCHAAVAGRFRRVILDQFQALYRDNDVLQNLLDEAYEQIETNHHRLPAVPARGTYQIEEVLNATHAFA